MFCYSQNTYVYFDILLPRKRIWTIYRYHTNFWLLHHPFCSRTLMSRDGLQNLFFDSYRILDFITSVFRKLFLSWNIKGNNLYDKLMIFVVPMSTLIMMNCTRLRWLIAYFISSVHDFTSWIFVVWGKRSEKCFYLYQYLSSHLVWWVNCIL